MSLKRCLLIFGIFCFFVSLQGKEYTEADILELVKKYLPENPVILEAGAHYGEDTLKISAMWPLGTVHAFEPLPQSFEILKQKVSSSPNVKPYSYALNDYIGKANFYICTNGDSASSLLPPQPILDPILFFDKKPIEVDCITLDYWASKNRVDHIDFMWLDMEGAELIVLKASPQILPTVKVIYTEVNFQEFRAGNCFYEEIKEWLEAQGFKIVWQHLWDTWNMSWQGNVLFVRE